MSPQTDEARLIASRDALRTLPRRETFEIDQENLRLPFPVRKVDNRFDIDASSSDFEFDAQEEHEKRQQSAALKSIRVRSPRERFAATFAALIRRAASTNHAAHLISARLSSSLWTGQRRDPTTTGSPGLRHRPRRLPRSSHTTH